MSCIKRKPDFWNFDQVQLKPSCTATLFVKRVEMLNLESRGIVLSLCGKQRRLLTGICVLVSLKQSAGFLIMGLRNPTAKNEMRFESQGYVQTTAQISPNIQIIQYFYFLCVSSFNSKLDQVRTIH